jgi:alpha-galactosidase
LILPEQSGLWAVLHGWDTPRRLIYSLTATFLGRMCLSGPIAELSEAQLAIVKQATLAYREVVSVIRDGESRIIRETNRSWRHPKGWQCVIRETEAAGDLLVVHTFGNEGTVSIELPQPKSRLKWQALFVDPDLELNGGSVPGTIDLEPWSGAVFHTVLN